MFAPKFLALGFVLAGGLFATTALSTFRTPQVPEPDEYHLMIHKDVGVWDGDFEMDMMGQKLEGKVIETVEAFGDFWTISTLEGSLMGTPFQGTYQLGYDPEAKEFIGTWIDTLSYKMAVMKGGYDTETRTLTMRYKGPDMLGREVEHWNTAHHDELGRRIFEGWVKDPEGNEVKTMTITYTRRPEKKGL